MGETVLPRGVIGDPPSGPSTDGQSKKIPQFVSYHDEAPGERYRSDPAYGPEHEEFGEVWLRIEPGMHPRLSSVDLALFVTHALEYGRLQLQIEELARQQEPHEKVMRGMFDKHPGLRGIGSARLDRTVTGDPTVSLSPNPARLREQAGTKFPQIAVEEQSTTVTIPEGFLTRSGRPMTADQVREYISLALTFVGLDDEMQAKHVKWGRAAKVHEDRGVLYEAVRDGEIDPDILGAKETIKMNVRKLPKPKTRRGSAKAGSAS